MNGEHQKDDELDDNHLANIHSSSNSTTSSVSCQLPTISNPVQAKKSQLNRRRAFFPDDVIVNNEHTLTIDDNQTNLSISIEHSNTEENSPILTNINEENQSNKPFKRKVVSFSTMPFEKKVADGM